MKSSRCCCSRDYERIFMSLAIFDCIKEWNASNLSSFRDDEEWIPVRYKWINFMKLTNNIVKNQLTAMNKLKISP
jgi:hypothetical protein